MEMIKPVKPHLVVLASPGLGHLIPVLGLGKCLVTLFNFNVTIFVVPSNTPAEVQLLHSAMTSSTIDPKLLQIIQLHPVDIYTFIDQGATLVTRLCIMMRQIQPAFRRALSDLKFRPTALVVDLFGTEYLAVGKELGVPSYVYVPCNAWFLALTVHLPTLDKEVEGQFVDLSEPVEIPGCRPIRPGDLVDPMMNRTHQEYFEYVRIGVEMVKADGILVNTWEALESITLAAFRDEKYLGHVAKVPVYPIGPVRRSVGPVDSWCEVMNWLDQQPKESVVFVSFGSGGTLSFDQMVELAFGLELSQQRFIWVVRRPTVDKRDGSFFTVGSSGDDDDIISSCLPDGFLGRTQNVGMVIPQWAPQSEILSHPSIGLFLSHCGWNSVLESITEGIPMIAWPLYAEQKMNATLLVEELGVAVRPKKSLDGVVKKEEIERVIRCIMVDGEENKIRKRIKEVKDSAEMALDVVSGSSYNALSLIAKEVNKM